MTHEKEGKRKKRSEELEDGIEDKYQNTKGLKGENLSVVEPFAS